MTDQLVARFAKRFVRGATIDVDFCQTVNAFSVTALIGPSGCGKTTLLRSLAGLTRPDCGRIEFADKVWFESRTRFDLSPQQREIGFLFQEYALFPHLTVAQNIGYSLNSCSRVERNRRVNEIADRFGLGGLEQRLPRQLSGGQQQRVALARALVSKPKLLLLDEPLSALDSLLRDQMRVELRGILSEAAIPVVFVTHDRVEAISLADRIAVMDSGSIQQIGTIQEVFAHPKTASIARLVGVESIVPGEIVEICDGLATVSVGSTRLTAVAISSSKIQVYVCIKGEDVSLQKGEGVQSSVRNHLSGTVISLVPEGPLVRVGLNCGFELTALITRPACEELNLRSGDTVVAMIKAPAIHLVERSIDQ